jgi:hypothetical protein
MAGLWEIIVAEATTNLVTNPSFETGTTGWTATAGGIAQSATNQRFGLYSCAWTPSSGTTDSVYFGTISTTNGVTYTFTLYVLGVLNIPYRLYFGTTGAAVLGTPVTFTGTGTWQRITVTYTETSSTTRRLYLGKNTSASVGIVYVDGAQCEAKAYATTYCDGSRTGCTWAGSANASTSSRDAQSAAGGRVYNLDNYNVYVEDMPGVGMPPLTNIATPLALQDGAVFQRTLAKPRVFTLKVTVYNATAAQSLAGLHSLRKALIDVIKPDRLDAQQPFILQYNGGGSKVGQDAGLLRCRAGVGHAQRLSRGTWAALYCLRPVLAIGV